MDIVVHRVNEAKALSDLPREYGVELDVRADRGRIILHHDPHQPGDDFEDYLNCYEHGLMVVNIKESGIENQVMDMLAQRGIERYFLLDVEFPWIAMSPPERQARASMRFSEYEPPDVFTPFAGTIEWVWMDCFTKIPMTESNRDLLEPFKLCFVCPERWGRPQDIAAYKAEFERLGRMPDAVMTGLNYVKEWC